MTMTFTEGRTRSLNPGFVRKNPPSQPIVSGQRIYMKRIELSVRNFSATRNRAARGNVFDSTPSNFVYNLVGGKNRREGRRDARRAGAITKPERLRHQREWQTMTQLGHRLGGGGRAKTKDWATERKSADYIRSWPRRDGRRQ